MAASPGQPVSPLGAVVGAGPAVVVGAAVVGAAEVGAAGSSTQVVSKIRAVTENKRKARGGRCFICEDETHGTVAGFRTPGRGVQGMAMVIDKAKIAEKA